MIRETTNTYILMNLRETYVILELYCFMHVGKKKNNVMAEHTQCFYILRRFKDCGKIARNSRTCLRTFRCKGKYLKAYFTLSIMSSVISYSSKTKVLKIHSNLLHSC